MLYKYIYLIILFLSLLIYIIYKSLAKDLTKDKIKNIRNITIILTGLTYFYIIFKDLGWLYYNLNRTSSILIVLSLSLLIYTYGLLKNKKEVYQNNINYYIIFYLVLLVSMTIFIYRNSIEFNFKNFPENLKFYLDIYEPFKHLTKYYFIANLVMLMPLSLLLMLKDDKFKKISNQFIIIITTTISIELLQVLTNTGAFDLDDIILNFLGSIIFALIIVKTNIINYIKKLFYNDFNLNNKIKYILFLISTIIPILFILNTIKITLNF